jgi:hypothetical protein
MLLREKIQAGQPQQKRPLGEKLHREEQSKLWFGSRAQPRPLEPDAGENAVTRGLDCKHRFVGFHFEKRLALGYALGQVYRRKTVNAKMPNGHVRPSQRHSHRAAHA